MIDNVTDIKGKTDTGVIINNNIIRIAKRNQFTIPIDGFLQNFGKIVNNGTIDNKGKFKNENIITGNGIFKGIPGHTNKKIGESA